MKPGIWTLLGTGLIVAVATLVAGVIICAPHTRRLVDLKDAEAILPGYLLPGGQDDDPEPCDTAGASIGDNLLQSRPPQNTLCPIRA